MHTFLISFIGFFLFFSNNLIGQDTQYDPLIPKSYLKAIHDALDTTQIIAIGESHGIQEMENIYLGLLESPKFLASINDIVIEMGNCKYQSILDRFIYGEEVSKDSLRLIWLNHTNSLLQSGNNRSLEIFLSKVREKNKSLPATKKIRVLAGDPPIDWNNIKTAKEFWPYLGRRDRNYARIVWDEVIDKNRRALMIMGRAHFKRVNPKPLNYINLITVLEKRLSKKIPVIHLYKKKLDGYNNQIPFIAKINKTKIGDERRDKRFPDIPFEDQVDAILYLGEGKKLNDVISPPFKEKWLKELDKRSMIVHGKPFQLPIYDRLKFLISKDGIVKAKEWYTEMLSEGSKRYDNSAFYLNYLGYEYLEKEMLTEAIEVFKLCVFTYPESANAYDSLAEALFKANKIELAKFNYQKSLELNPKNQNAKSMLDKINGNN